MPIENDCDKNNNKRAAFYFVMIHLLSGEEPNYEKLCADCRK